ncbi:MAG TPA: YkuS family protein [Firmicutes bacterium]|nr:YkuS family protein [Bacillota bacterium]
MPHIIAVDENLGNVKRYLNERGFQTTDLTGSKEAAAVVVSGLSDNYLGDQRTATEAPIIEARGLSEAQILAEVKKAVRRH